MFSKENTKKNDVSQITTRKPIRTLTNQGKKIMKGHH